MPRPGGPCDANAAAPELRVGGHAPDRGDRRDPRGAKAAALTDADGGRFEVTRASARRVVRSDVRKAEAARAAPSAMKRQSAHAVARPSRAVARPAGGVARLTTINVPIDNARAGYAVSSPRR